MRLQLLEFSSRFCIPLRRSAFLVLPATKTDLFRWGVTSTISAAPDGACAIKSLRNLVERFPKTNYYALFWNTSGNFSRNYVTRKLQAGLRILGYEGNYTGHSFRRGAATSARLVGLSEEEIQLLGRWEVKLLSALHRNPPRLDT